MACVDEMKGGDVGNPDRPVDTPNNLLRLARLGRLPTARSGRRMSRAELAEAVNARMYAATGMRVELDASYIGKLERGRIRWPLTVRRRAFREVLGVATDAEIGFCQRRSDIDEAFLTKLDSEGDGGPAVAAAVPVPAPPVASRVAPADDVPVIGAAPTTGPVLSCTVEGTGTGGVRIVVELEPVGQGGEPALVVTSGSTAQVYPLTPGRARRRELPA